MAPRMHMRDQCHIGLVSVEDNNTPYPDEGWNFGNKIGCRLSRTSTTEVLEGSETADTNSMIHIKAGVEVKHDSIVKIVRRNNENISPVEFYNIVGEPHKSRGNREIILMCNKMSKGQEPN